MIRGERKGITGKVTVGGKEPKHWQIFSLSMNDVDTLKFSSDACEGPCFHRTQLDVPSAADTYLDTTGLHKGMLWVNQQPLGRFWSIGPQHALYLPGPWLKHGANQVVFFDLLSDAIEPLKSADKPIFDTTDEHRQ